jgi:hypothetical protein
MDNKKLLSFSIIFLALSILLGSIWIGSRIDKFANNWIASTTAHSAQGLIPIEDAATYLNITVDELKGIISKDEQDKNNLGVYPTYSFIPYIVISKGDIRFNKSELDKWISYKMHNQ